MKEHTSTGTADAAWKGLYRLGAVAALVAVIFFRRNCGTELATLGDLGILPSAPTHPYTGRPVDMAFVLTTRDCPPEECTKWHRPLDLVIGIDVESWVEREASAVPRQTVADDFISDGRPIRVVEWHGSYPGWLADKPDPEGALPPIQPEFFRIGWWTDVPAGTSAEMPWSHPGALIEEVLVPMSEAHQAYAGTVSSSLARVCTRSR